jgi:peptidoglycan/LPS O-acetylase OafA/YrhL
MNLSPQNKTRLPNLDASRFLAFIPVFLSHVFITTNTNLQNASWFSFFKSAFDKGLLGLDYFFVLSAFIITWLAMQEKRKRGEFFSLAFFLRRILRTWPIYFLIVGLGFALKMFYDPIIHSLPDWQWWISFSINFFVAENGFNFLFFMVVLWSIAVEEQFYFLWGFILEAPAIFLPLMSILLIVLSLIFRCNALADNNMLYFHSLSIGGNFGIGALLAWWSFHHPEKLISKNLVRLVYLLLLISILAYSYIFSNPLMIVFERLWFSLCFAVLIFDWAFSPKPFTQPGNNKWFNQLGKISLGLYLFHAVVITFFSYYNYRFDWSENPLQVLLINPLIILLITVFLAALSFKYFETPFLNLRKRFMM